MDVRSESGMTALMSAAKGGKPETIQYLWEEGAVLHAFDNSGHTAAHFAAQEDHANCITMLYDLCKEQIEAIQLSAELAAQENAANGLAAKREDTDTGDDDADVEPEEPLSEESVLNRCSQNGTRPLHIAAGFDSQDVIRALIALGVVNVSRNWDGWE